MMMGIVSLKYTGCGGGEGSSGKVVRLVLRMGKVLADTLFMHKNKFFT